MELRYVNLLFIHTLTAMLGQNDWRTIHSLLSAGVAINVLIIQNISFYPLHPPATILSYVWIAKVLIYIYNLYLQQYSVGTNTCSVSLNCHEYSTRKIQDKLLSSNNRDIKTDDFERAV